MNDPQKSPIDAAGFDSETGQTGQEAIPEPVRQPYFEIALDDHQAYHWCLWSANGRAMAINAIPYKTQADCVKAIDAFRQQVSARTRITIAHS